MAKNGLFYLICSGVSRLPFFPKTLQQADFPPKAPARDLPTGKVTFVLSDVGGFLLVLVERFWLQVVLTGDKFWNNRTRQNVIHGDGIPVVKARFGIAYSGRWGNSPSKKRAFQFFSDVYRKYRSMEVFPVIGSVKALMYERQGEFFGPAVGVRRCLIFLERGH